MEILLKALLALMQGARDASAAIYDVIAMNSDSALVTELLEEGKGYGATFKNEGRNHSMGPPAPYLWVALITTLIKISDECEQRARL